MKASRPNHPAQRTNPRQIHYLYLWMYLKPKSVDLDSQCHQEYSTVVDLNFKIQLSECKQSVKLFSSGKKNVVVKSQRMNLKSIECFNWQSDPSLFKKMQLNIKIIEYIDKYMMQWCLFMFNNFDVCLYFVQKSWTRLVGKTLDWLQIHLLKFYKYIPLLLLVLLSLTSTRCPSTVKPFDWIV